MEAKRNRKKARIPDVAITVQAHFLAGRLDRIKNEDERELAMFRAVNAIDAQAEVQQLLTLSRGLDRGAMQQLLGYATGLALGSGKTKAAAAPSAKRNAVAAKVIQLFPRPE